MYDTDGTGDLNSITRTELSIGPDTSQVLSNGPHYFAAAPVRPKDNVFKAPSRFSLKNSY